METINEAINVAYYPVKWVVDLMSHGLVFPDNSFQRRYVWSTKHQVKLIESILTGYPIPEIYLWQKSVDAQTGESIYNIIDGQQRLGAIQQYVNNQFELKTSYLDGANKGSDFSGKFFSSLSNDLKTRFWSYRINFRIVRNYIEYDEIVKMFLRLNSVNLTLNPQELRNAEFSGKFIELAAELADNYVFKKHGLFSANDIRRMKDIEFVSNILTFFRRGISEDTTQETINRMYDIYNNDYSERDEDKHLFEVLAIEVDKIINDNKAVESFLRRHTHLYILFLALYTNNLKGNHVTLNQVSLYYDFVLANTKSDFLDKLAPALIHLIEEYKLLSSTGTQKKQNRMKRASILMNFLGV